MDLSKKSVRDPAIDTLRAIAVVAVIAIHTTTRTLEASGYDFSQFGTTLFFNQVLRFAVPLFFAVSGFVLELNAIGSLSYVKYFKKRLGRLALPYVFWSAVYYFFIYRTHTHNFINSLLLGDSSYQLYFIPAILIFYCLFPFLHRWYKHLTRVWVLGSLGLIQVLLLTYDYYVHPISLITPLNTALLNFFIFILGIVAARNRTLILQVFKHFYRHLLLAVLPLAIFIFLEGRDRYLSTQNYLSFYSQWRPDVLVYTILVGLLLYGYFSSGSRFTKIGLQLSKLSYFIFFCHIAVLELVWKLIGPHFASPGFDLYFFISVTLISILSAFLIHKLPQVSRFTG